MMDQQLVAPGDIGRGRQQVPISGGGGIAGPRVVFRAAVRRHERTYRLFRQRSVSKALASRDVSARQSLGERLGRAECCSSFSVGRAISQALSVALGRFRAGS